MKPPLKRILNSWNHRCLIRRQQPIEHLNYGRKEGKKKKKKKIYSTFQPCLWKGLLGRGNFFAEWQREESHLSPLMHVIMSKGPSKRDRRSKKKRKEIQQLRMRSKYAIATYPSKILSLENIWNALTETIKRPGACYRNM